MIWRLGKGLKIGIFRIYAGELIDMLSSIFHRIAAHVTSLSLVNQYGIKKIAAMPLTL